MRRRMGGGSSREEGRWIKGIGRMREGFWDCWMVLCSKNGYISR